MTTTRKCLLCGQPFHKRPKEVAYGLKCPNDEAPREKQDAYLQAFGDAKLIEEQYGTTAACSPPLVARIMARQDAARERFAHKPEREVLPVQLLQDDCNVRTPQVAAMVERNARLAPIEWEPPDNLQVPGKVPTPSTIALVAGKKRYGEAEDAALFLGNNGVGK